MVLCTRHLHDITIASIGHGFELPFVFDSFNPWWDGVEPTSDEVNLSEEMMRYWINFAKTGNPNSQGSTTWPQYTTETSSAISFETPFNVVSNFSGLLRNP